MTIPKNKQICLFFLYFIECYCYKLYALCEILYYGAWPHNKEKKTNIFDQLIFGLYIFGVKSVSRNVYT